MKNGQMIAPGVKAVRLDQLPAEAWRTLVGDTEPLGVAKLYQSVAWLYRTVNIRAQAVAGMPWEIRRGENVVVSSDDVALPKEWAWLEQLPGLLLRTEAAAILDGRAYWHKRRERPRANDDLRWLLPSSIHAKIGEDGLRYFERQLARRRVTFDVDEIVYFWPPDPYVEIGPAKYTPAMAAMSSAGVLHNLEQFTATFFERGAVKATLLTYQEMITDDEKARVKEWWKRVVAGIKNAFSAEVVRGDFAPVTIGEGLESLSNTELTEMEREAICTALGVPQSKVTANAANFATKQSDDKMFIDDTIAPECEWLASVLNEQLFDAFGVSLRFRPDTLSIMQEDEEQRAASLLNLVNAGMNLEMAVQVLGYDLPDGVELREEKPEPPPMQPGGPIPTPTGDPPDVAEEKAVFRRWLKNRKNPNLADFETDILTPQQKAMVALEEGIYGGGSSQDNPFGKDTPRIKWQGAPLDQNHRYEIVGGIGTTKAPREIERDPLNPDGREMRRMERQGQERINEALQAHMAYVFDGLTDDTARMAVSRARSREAVQILQDAVVSWLQSVAEAGVAFGRHTVEREVFGTKRIEDALNVGMWDIANDDAARWAIEYGANLTGQIANTTSLRIQREVAWFIENGETLEALTARIADGYWYSAERARSIAVTEVTRAYAQGSMAAWSAAGVVELKEWRTATDELVCQICGPLAGQVQPLGSDFESDQVGGLDSPPAHVNCRCWVVPKIVEADNGN